MPSTPSVTSLNQQSQALDFRYFGKSADGSAQAADAAGVTGVDKIANAAAGRQQFNLQILQVSAEVSIQAGNDSLSLLYRSAIVQINDGLAPEFGPDAIQGRLGEDNSPEATAGRILSLSLGFFEAYSARHADADPAQRARDFVDLIRSGFEQGFNEAVEILRGLQVFSGEIESGVMKTFELVSKGLDDFLNARLAEAAEAGTAAGGEAPTGTAA